MRQCTAAGCRFRFPLAAGETAPLCPRCGAETALVARWEASGEGLPAFSRPPGPELVVLLDNIRSVLNVGSMFRTADGAGMRHLYLCGITPTPAHPRLAKTALGAEQTLPWSSHANGLDTALALKSAGYRLWAVENRPGSPSLYSASLAAEAGPIALIFGNEKAGIDPGILAHCHQILAIPMLGQKNSLNVAVAFGIAVYTVRFALGAAA